MDSRLRRTKNTSVGSSDARAFAATTATKPLSQALVRAVRLSAGFWRDPRGTTRRWRAEGIAPGRVEIDPPAPGTVRLYLLPDPFDTGVEAARLARTAHVD
jgi:hypothetical protein